MKVLFAAAAAMTIATAVPAAAQSVELGLHGLKIAVQDPAKTTRFYTILGMAAGPRYNSFESELHWAGATHGAAIIMVEDQAGRPPRPKGGSSLMITVADVAATIAQLKQAGFAVQGEPRVTPRATIMMLKDPDGNSIELLGGPFGSSAKPAP